MPKPTAKNTRIIRSEQVLRQNLTSAYKQPAEISKRVRLSLRRMAFMLAHAIERLWGIAEVLQFQPSFVLS